jgi:hypothetical protein
MTDDDGRCPDSACRKVLKPKDYSVGICPHCDGVLTDKIIRQHSEKIKPRPAMAQNKGTVFPT